MWEFDLPHQPSDAPPLRRREHDHRRAGTAHRARLRRIGQRLRGLPERSHADRALCLPAGRLLGAPRGASRVRERLQYQDGEDSCRRARAARPEVPRPRRGGRTKPFYPQALERGVRSEQALRLALAEMYVQGVSTRKVRAITEQLCGTEISSSEVSRVAARLDEKLEQWRTRKKGQVRYLAVDATYVKVRESGSVIDCAVLVAAGVQADGKRSVLGCSVSLSEADVHWRSFLESLMERGLHGVELVTSDDRYGLRAALRAVLPSEPAGIHLRGGCGTVTSRKRLTQHLELLRCQYILIRLHSYFRFGSKVRTPAMQGRCKGDASRIGAKDAALPRRVRRGSGLARLCPCPDCGVPVRTGQSRGRMRRVAQPMNEAPIVGHLPCRLPSRVPSRGMLVASQRHQTTGISAASFSNYDQLSVQ